MKTAIIAIILVGSSCAFGQVFEAGVFGGVSALQNGVIGNDIVTSGAAAGAKIKLTDGVRFGFRMGFNPFVHTGFEFGYAYNRTQLHFDGPPVSEQGMAIHQGFGDALWHVTKEGSRIRPFVAGGIHFSNFVPPGSSATSGGGNTKFGVNYGFGVKAKLTSTWQIRFDFRQYETGKPFDLPGASGRLLQNEISGGVALTL
jgi:opacity protein-like surface antigen